MCLVATAIHLLFAACALAGETLRYTLAPDPATHTIAVTLAWSTGDRTQSHLAIAPHWASVNDPAEFLRDPKVAASGDAHAAEPHSWIVNHQPNEEITCHYTVDTGHRSFDWDCIYEPIVWRRFFHGIGHTFLITPDPTMHGSEPFDVAIEWQLPPDWGDAVCTFGTGVRTRGLRTATELRHSVFLAGDLDVMEYDTPNGVPLHIAMFDVFDFDIDTFAASLAAIVDAEVAFMQDEAFPAYTVTLIPVGDPSQPGRGRRAGTGLHRGCAMFLPPMTDLDTNVRFLFAHELFHHYNGGIVKRVQPEEEVYWLTEGFTDYYAWRILLEAFGPMRPDLMTRWNRKIERYHANPANDAPNAEVAAGFWTERETLGEVPYQRGALLAMRWHAIARAHGIEEGIDRLWFDLVERAREHGEALSNEHIRARGVATLGEWFADEFDLLVEGGEIVRLPPGCLEPLARSTEQVRHAYDLGFDFEQSRAAGAVRGLREASAAWHAGLRERDQLVGWRFTPGESDEPAQFTVMRDGEAVEIEFLPRGRARRFNQFELR